MLILRIDSGIGWDGYRATLYGPGLPAGEPVRDMNVVTSDIERAIRQVRALRPLPRDGRVFGVTKELLADLETHRRRKNGGDA